KRRLDRAGVGVSRTMVVRKVLVDYGAVAEVAVICLHQRGADAPAHAADHLRARGLGIEYAAGREPAEHAPHADLASIPIHADFGEMRAEGVMGVAVVEIGRGDRSLRFPDPRAESALELAARPKHPRTP